MLEIQRRFDFPIDVLSQRSLGSTEHDGARASLDVVLTDLPSQVLVVFTIVGLRDRTVVKISYVSE